LFSLWRLRMLRARRKLTFAICTVLCDAGRVNASSTKQDTALFRKVLSTLNEAQRRWLVGREALRRGRGGIERMVEASGLSKPTILKGIRELGAKRKLAVEGGRVRKPGGGRKPIEDRDPHITRLLEQVMAESTVGDPMSPLKWNSKSTYQIQQHLASQGHRISEDTIQRRLRKLDYSLQANRTDRYHPDPRRDELDGIEPAGQAIYWERRTSD